MLLQGHSFQDSQKFKRCFVREQWPLSSLYFCKLSLLAPGSLYTHTPREHLHSGIGRVNREESAGVPALEVLTA